MSTSLVGTLQGARVSRNRPMRLIFENLSFNKYVNGGVIPPPLLLQADMNGLIRELTEVWINLYLVRSFGKHKSWSSLEGTPAFYPILGYFHLAKRDESQFRVWPRLLRCLTRKTHPRERAREANKRIEVEWDRPSLFKYFHLQADWTRGRDKRGGIENSPLLSPAAAAI